ncbi:MAG TPA: hypothetical protein VFQ81_02510 [Candidatus Limnocylindria bacterium]|nr:hypothetical protein [Candidatus Limnocylindria bacterium]
MRRLVLDGTVLIRWFSGDGGRAQRAARSLRAEYEAGTLAVIVPTAARLDLLDTAASALPAKRLGQFADAVERLGLEFREPAPRDVAEWVARGLTAGEAAYAAVAAAADLRLVTANPRLHSVAAPMVTPLA